ncbi:MAG: hypothetical protein AABY33_07345 [Pseudomonadota bacterium]
MNKLILLCLLLLFMPLNLMAETYVGSPADLLSGSQREYYQRVFNYVMEHYKDEKPYEWKSGAEKGSIRVSKQYISKSKSLCRNFSESFVVDGESGKYEGVACKRESKGWCRLKSEDVHTCALEQSEDITDKIMRDADGAVDKGNEFIRNTKDWWNR